MRRLIVILLITFFFYPIGLFAGMPANYSNVKHDASGSVQNMTQENTLFSSASKIVGLNGAVSPSSATNGSAGSGFSGMVSSISSGLSGFKKMITDAINAVINFFTGSNKLECEGLDTPLGVAQCFYVDDAQTQLSSSDLQAIKKNISIALSQSSGELLADATTIVNSTAKYDDDKEKMEKTGSSSENITTALQNRTEGEFAFNNMVMSLLTMDTKKLEIESVAVFQAINKAKQPSMGVGGDMASGITGIIGGILK